MYWGIKGGLVRGYEKMVFFGGGYVLVKIRGFLKEDMVSRGI